MLPNRVIAGLAIALSGQVLFTACSQAELQNLLHSDGVAIATSEEPKTNATGFSPYGGQQYGVDGTLSAQQLSVLRGLAWPQAYEDMKGTFGFPSHRTENADYYAISNDPNTWVVVFYQGPTATGYTTEARQ